MSAVEATNAVAENDDRTADPDRRGAAVPTAPSPAERPGEHGYISDKDAYLKRMSRIEGQARGISRMIAEDTYCIDILTQVSALTRALQGVATGLLDDHLAHCVLDAAKRGDEEGTAKLKEASDAISRLVRS